METGLNAIKRADNAGKVTRNLLELETAAGVRVAEEIELTGGDNGLIRLILLLEIEVVNRLSSVSTDIARADSRLTDPSLAIGWLATVSTVRMLLRDGLSVRGSAR